MIRDFIGRYWLIVFVVAIYFFLYLPIAVLIAFSFNSVSYPYEWVSFSTKWYKELWLSSEIWEVTRNSIIVAVSTVTLSLVLGMLFVFYSARNRLQSFTPLFYANLAIPEIVIAVGLLSLFNFFSVPLGFTTLIAGHTLIGLGYSIPILYARLVEIDYSLIEASLDLGATLHQTFFSIVIPLMTPAFVACALLVFILSLDDFIIAFFCTGETAQTLSLYILSTIKTGVTPTINALSTCMLLFSSLLVIVFCSLRSRVRIF